MIPRLLFLAWTLLLAACGGGGIDGARLGVPDVAPEARLLAARLDGWTSEDVDRPEGSGVVLDARASLGVRFRWRLMDLPANAAVAWRIHGADRPVALFTADTPGNYRLRLTVENRSGDRSHTDFTVVLRRPQGPLAPPPRPQTDSDGDGVPDALDPDSDNDGVPDPLDGAPQDADTQDWPRAVEIESTPAAVDNGRPGQAQPLPSWSPPGLQVLGALGSADDVDFYRIDLPPGRYGLALQGDAASPQVNLFSGDDRAQPLLPLPTPHGRLWVFTLAAGGERRLVVSGEAPTGYTLTLYPDDDLDGLPDALETALGSDPQRPDSDGDGLLDAEEALPFLLAAADQGVDDYDPDPDADGRPPWLDRDSDGDGLPDALEGGGDADGDGLPDAQDVDSDDNGVDDGEEAGARALVEGPRDSDGDGVPDPWDRDDDGDGLWDVNEPEEGRLRPAPPWDPGPGLAGRPRVDTLGVAGLPPGLCRPGEGLVLRGARLPVDGSAVVAIRPRDSAGEGAGVNLTPETRSTTAWTFPCPDLPPGKYRLRPFHEGRAGPALDLTVVAPQAPLLTALDFPLDRSNCDSGYRLHLSGEGLSPPYVLTLPAGDGVRYIDRLGETAPLPCLPADTRRGTVRFSNAAGDSPPLPYAPPPLRADLPFTQVITNTPLVVDGGQGTPERVEETGLVPLVLPSTEDTLVLLWRPEDAADGARLLGGGVVPRGADEPTVSLADPVGALTVLARLGLGDCRKDESGWPAIDPAAHETLTTLLAQGLALPPTSEAEQALEDLFRALPQSADCPRPEGVLYAFAPVQPVYAGRLAVHNDSGLPVALAYQDQDGRWLIPPADGPRPPFPGWLPGPPARLMPVVDGQSGLAWLTTPGSSGDMASVDARLWRWAWLTAVARALWPAYAPFRPATEEGDDLARLWPTVPAVEALLHEALETAWNGEPRRALARLARGLAQAALDAEQDALLQRQGTALAWARRRLALTLVLMERALAADRGPFARLAAALEDTPALRVQRIDFAPALLGVSPQALVAGRGDASVTLHGRGLRAVTREVLGYPTRRLPWVEVSTETGEARRLAAERLSTDQRRLTLRLPAALVETPGTLTLRLHQPLPEGGEVTLPEALTLLVQDRPLLTAVTPDSPRPGGEWYLAGVGLDGTVRADLIGDDDTPHALTVAATDGRGLLARLPPDLAAGEYRLQVQVRGADGTWEDVAFADAALARVEVTEANVVFRLCDAGTLRDDSFALYLDGVYQGRFDPQSGLPYREFAFALEAGSSHRLSLHLLDGGDDGQGTYGLEPRRGLAIFGGDPVSGELAEGAEAAWGFRVAAEPIDNAPTNPVCPEDEGGAQPSAP